MARLFTVPFQYKDQTYTAVVSFIHHNDKLSVAIHLPDESLHPILGSDTIFINANEELPINASAITPAQELLVAIMAASEQKDQQRKRSVNEHKTS